MVPTELLVTAMVGGLAIALTSVVAMAGVLSNRVGDVRGEVSGLRADFGELRAEFGEVRRSW